MITCSRCGSDTTGKKFCPECGTAVHTAATCPQCKGEVTPGAAFCMHCGGSLGSQINRAAPPPPPPPTNQSCPACNSIVPGATAFCTNCGHDMHAPVSQAFCNSCGRPNTSGARFCNGCGAQLGSNPAQTGYPVPGQYQQPNTQYPQQAQYQPGTQYPQQGQYQSGAQYPQQGQYNQYGQPYPQQPYASGPMVLRCPTCMAMAPLGTPACVSCRTSLAGIAPTPANMPVQGQQGSFWQSGNGKMAMGALGGAAAVIGGEMLLHNLTDGDRHRDHDGGLLGGLGELADDIGLI